jgi:hypothetical protein
MLSHTKKLFHQYLNNIARLQISFELEKFFLSAVCVCVFLNGFYVVVIDIVLGNVPFSLSLMNHRARQRQPQNIHYDSPSLVSLVRDNIVQASVACKMHFFGIWRG